MMPRLVLVGLVATLGISVPTWCEVRGCIKAVHSWTARRLAALDHGSSRADESFAVVPPRRPGPAFEPIVPEEGDASLAEELNRMAQGLEIPLEATIARRRAEPASRNAPAPAPARHEPRVGTVESMELALLGDLLGAEGGAAGVGSTCGAIASRRTKPVVPPIACVFTRSVAVEPAAGTEAEDRTRSGLRTEHPAPRFAPIEPSVDSGGDIAMALNRFAEGIDLDPAARGLAKRGKPAFEPIDPAAGRITSLGDELNLRSDGLNLVLVHSEANDSGRPAPAPGKSPIASVGAHGRLPASIAPSSDVEHALRLTTDALHAWMKIVAGPAPVRISSR